MPSIRKCEKFERGSHVTRIALRYVQKMKSKKRNNQALMHARAKTSLDCSTARKLVSTGTQNKNEIIDFVFKTSTHTHVTSLERHCRTFQAVKMKNVRFEG